MSSIIVFLFLLMLHHGNGGKTEELFNAIQNSKYHQDILLLDTTILCRPCNSYLAFKTSSQYSNVVRHLTSDQHKMKAKWTLGKDGSCKIVSTVQTTNLLHFFKTSQNKIQQHTETQFRRKTDDRPQFPQQLPVSTLLVKDILAKETEILNKQKIEVSKSNELTKSILNEERLALASQGQENLQLKDQIVTSVEYLESIFHQNIESVLSKFNYMDSVPTLFMSNLLYLSSQITMGVEKSDLREQELIDLSESFIVERYQTMCTITQQRENIKSQYSTNEILSKVKNSFLEETKNYPETLVGLSILLEKDNFISIFLHDIIGNMNRKRPVWSDTTLSMFSLLLNYGGPMTAELVSKNFGGPHLSTVYIKSRQLVFVENTLQADAFSSAASFYKKILDHDQNLQNIIFTLAVDATPILPLIRAKGNRLIGFATSEKVEVSTAEDILNTFKNKELKTAQQTYVFILTPLRHDIPYFILAAPPVVKGENHETVAQWIRNARHWGKEKGINILGIGADGDSKVRSYYLRRFLKEENQGGFSITRDDFNLALPFDEESGLYECPFPDPRHLIKKWRNQILNVRRFLVLGNYGIQLEHLMELSDCEQYKHKLGLWKTDIKVNDKQNVNAAVRLFHPNVQECLQDFDPILYTGTVCYLKLGTMLHKMYFEKDIIINLRIKYAWTLIQFLRLWKRWIGLSGYKTDINFISDQTYKDVLIAGQSLILFAKLHHKEYAAQPFEPWVWGSNSCEEVFGKARCYVRTKNNFCHAEFLDICKRLQKVSENERNPYLKTKSSSYVYRFETFPTTEFEAMLEKEMLNGDYLACELAKDVGLHTLLLGKKTIEGDLDLRHVQDLLLPSKDQFGTSTEDANNPDEMEILTKDEIGSLSETEIIQTTLGNDPQTIHSDDLQDLACDFSSSDASNFQIQSETESTSQMESETERISQNQSETQSTSQIQPETESTSQIQSETEKIGLSRGEFTISKNLTDSYTCIDLERNKNTHIFYKGHWYHINQFVAWEQGKFYMPQQARLNRFYSNYVVFDKFVGHKNSSSSIKLNIVIATWKNGNYLIGSVKRMIQLPIRGKSAYPVFTWNKDSNRPVDIVIQEFSPVVDNATSLISKKYTISKNFVWTSGKDYVTTIDGTELENMHTISEGSYQRLKQAIEYLKKQDILEEKKGREEKKRKYDEKKKGPPEKMTVTILKSVLREKNIKFPSTARKADLVELVKKQMTGASQQGKNRSSRKSTTYRKKRTKVTSIFNSRTIFCSYVEVPVDFTKHFLYYLIKYMIELLILTGISVVLKIYLWLWTVMMYWRIIMFWQLFFHSIAEVNVKQLIDISHHLSAYMKYDAFLITPHKQIITLF